jgi:site-specific DNA-methyltransferase (adenine-specific)
MSKPSNNLSKLVKKDLQNKCDELSIVYDKTDNKAQLIKLITDTMANLLPDTTNTTDEPNNTKKSVPKLESDIKNIDGLKYLADIPDQTIDLILTDPPYIISRESGMNTHYNKVKDNETNNIDQVKTDLEWLAYKQDNNIDTDENKSKYMQFGTIYGKKYCVKTDYGTWDSEFTMDILELYIANYYKKLKKGGSLIIFFDLWKITPLRDLMEKYKFKQIRFIEWIKTNPQPINSSVNYLTNTREIALLGIKDSSPTFNSKYDKGIYEFPLQGGKNRFHPTQKSLLLFEALINKHSNPLDTVLDTFLGSGTTAIACKNTGRHFKGCEISKEYYDKIMELNLHN